MHQRTIENLTTEDLIKKIINSPLYMENKTIPTAWIDILLLKDDVIDTIVQLSQDEMGDDDKVAEARKINNALLDVLEKFLEKYVGITDEDRDRIKPMLNTTDAEGPKIRFFKEVSNMLHDRNYQQIKITI